jgi:riboflavin synthase
MFTGIITDIGTVSSVEKRGDLRLRLATGYDMARVDLGASIACHGICLTVVGKGEGWFDVDASAETLDKTNAGDWAAGTRINLERALKVGDELGGHIVSGHVDGVGHIDSITPEGDSKRFLFRAPKALAAYLAPKGSVALNGVSLTVNEVIDLPDAVQFGVNIIPHTQEWTSFGTAQPGERINIEIDVLARYVKRLKDVA